MVFLETVYVTARTQHYLDESAVKKIFEAKGRRRITRLLCTSPTGMTLAGDRDLKGPRKSSWCLLAPATDTLIMHKSSRVPEIVDAGA